MSPKEYPPNKLNLKKVNFFHFNGIQSDNAWVWAWNLLQKWVSQPSHLLAKCQVFLPDIHRTFIPSVRATKARVCSCEIDIHVCILIPFLKSPSWGLLSLFSTVMIFLYPVAFNFAKKLVKLTPKDSPLCKLQAWSNLKSRITQFSFNWIKQTVKNLAKFVFIL